MPTPEQVTAIDLSELNPIAEVLVRQMIFMDAPSHTRLRGLAAAAFTNRRVEALRLHIQEITDGLIEATLPQGRMDVIAELADLLPATVTAELMGVPVADRDQLKTWSKDFSEVLGGFQLNPGRTAIMLQTVGNMTAYFRDRLREQQRHPRDGVVHALMTAEKDGDRLTEEEVIANCNFWGDLAGNNSRRLLAVRTCAVLEWHFRYLLENDRLWIVTVVDGPRLVAYALFEIKDQNPARLKTIRLVDFQSLDGSTALLSPMPCWALRKCRSEGIHLLQNFGRWLEKGEFIEAVACCRRRLSNWTFFYHAPYPRLARSLQDRQAWKFRRAKRIWHCVTAGSGTATASGDSQI